MFQGNTVPNVLNIGLDYDDTFTADRDLWAGFVRSAKSRGYDVRFVTARFENAKNYDNEDIKQDAQKLGIPVIFCNGLQKANAVFDNGWQVDIWIDDFPVLIPTEPQLEGIMRGVKVYDNKQRTTFKSLMGSYPEEVLTIQSP